MPTYPYKSQETGEVVEKVMSMDDHDKMIKENGMDGFTDDSGIEWSRVHGDSSTIAGKSGDTWSQSGGFENERGETGSLSRAIHPDQVKEQMALDKQKGVTGVEWKPDGRGLVRPHYGSKHARDNWDRAYGFISESHY